MTRRGKSIVLALIGLLVLTSAGAILFDRTDGPVVPAYGGTYVEGIAGVPQYLNPIIASTNVDQDVSALVFSGLTRYDRDGTIVPDLADSFSTDAEGKVWRFTLRSNATWHDGADVTADDVVYTVGLLQDRAYVGPFSDAFRGVIAARVDAKTVTFTLPDAYGPFADSTTVPLLPSHLLAGVRYADLARHPFTVHPIGTGPFRFGEADARQVVLTRYDDFYRTKPTRSRAYLDKVILRFFRDPSEALAALARGEIDGTGGLSSVDAERARTLKDTSLYSLPTSDFTALFLNARPEKALFRDRVVRQAIATAIDRGRVLQVAADGRGRVADEFVAPSSWSYVKDVRRYPYSAEDARAMLDEADWRDHDGDGVRDKGGVALKFTITSSDEPARFAAAQQVAQDLIAAGMRVDVRAVPFAELVDRVARQRAFDVLLVGINLGNDPDPYPFFHSSQVKDPGDNFSGFATLPIDRALEAARRTYDQRIRRDLYTPVFQAIATEVPVVFLYFTDYLYAQRRSVNGLKIAPISEPTQRLWNVEDWYVKTVPRR